MKPCQDTYVCSNRKWTLKAVDPQRWATCNNSGPQVSSICGSTIPWSLGIYFSTLDIHSSNKILKKHNEERSPGRFLRASHRNDMYHVLFRLYCLKVNHKATPSCTQSFTDVISKHGSIYITHYPIVFFTNRSLKIKSCMHQALVDSVFPTWKMWPCSVLLEKR